MALSSKLDDDQSPFSLISQNLRRLGGFHIERLVDCPGIEFEAFDLPFFATHIDVPTTLSTQESDVAPVVLQENISSSMYNIVQLQQTCHQTFGNADALKFEFLEEHGPDREFLVQVADAAAALPCSLAGLFLLSLYLRVLVPLQGTSTCPDVCLPCVFDGSSIIPLGRTMVCCSSLVHITL